MWKKLLLMLLPLILKSISPPLRQFLITALDEAASRAELTETLWDDALVKLLKALLLGDGD